MYRKSIAYWEGSLDFSVYEDTYMLVKVREQYNYYLGGYTLTVTETDNLTTTSG